MSASGTSSTTDIAEKFQRLSREYHKVKEMCKVLSNGVNQERAKSLKLEAAFKEKEIAFRKIISEKEAVEFHNSQLTKRIELLQDELEKKSLEPKKKKKLKANEVNVDELYNKIKVLEDELFNKLQTNEALTRQINEFDEKEKSLRIEIQKHKDEIQEMKFMLKVAPIAAEYEKKNGFCPRNSCPTSPINGKMNGRNPFSEEEDPIPEPPKALEPKEKEIVRVDVEVQANLELNNNSSPGAEKFTAEIASKQEEILRLTENIRKLEDLKEKQCLDITLLKRKLELAGNSSVGMDSAEQATKLARARIREVMNEREETEKTARYYEKEVRLMQRNIRETLEEKTNLEDQIEKLKAANTQVSDELVSVRKSYDLQLSQMSELVIELNKKIESADRQPPPLKQESAPPARSLRNLFGK